MTDYYTFLTRMYMNDSQIVYPPSEGWPSIVNADPAALRSLGKSDEVLSLLAHLPYIRRPGNWNDDVDAIPDYPFAEWPDLISSLVKGWETGKNLRSHTEGVSFTSVAPPHVVGLVDGGHEATPVIVLDTELGIIHWEDYTYPWNIGKNWETVDWDFDDEVSQEEADWRHSATAWAIPDFFEVLKDEYRSMNWIPINAHTVYGSREEWNETSMVAMLRSIYKEHGWPDVVAYRKSECLEAVRNAVVKSHPDSVCSRG